MHMLIKKKKSSRSIIESTTKKESRSINKDRAGKVITAFKNNPDLSLQDMALTYGISKTHVFHLKKKHWYLTKMSKYHAEHN